MKMLERFMIEIDSEHKLGNNEYVRGRISGIVIGILGKDRCEGNVAWELHPDGTHIYDGPECTVFESKGIMKIIDDLYPGLCTFV